MTVSEIDGLLFDLDGVLYVGDAAIPGAAAALAHIQSLGLPRRFVTNTTTQSRAQLAAKLQAIDLPITADEILTTPHAARLYLKHRGYRSCHFLVADAVKDEFAEFNAATQQPDAVVIGDIGSAWNYDILNRVFEMAMAGAELIALHKGKFWQTADGLRMDIGAFVTGLEYATGKTAAVMGKPSPAFFALALRQLGLPASRIAMIGDDIDSDVGGAQRAGLQGILVKTGKYREAYTLASSVQPDLILDSVAELPRHLGR